GVGWFTHIEKVIEYHQQKRSFGGIGRDLSFGWAPLLNQVGFNLTESIEHGGVLQRVIGGHQDSINQLVHLMGDPGRHNAVLVGPVGVGKTTIAYAFAQKLVEDRKSIPADLRFHQVVTLDAANLIANAKGRGQLEELLIHVFNEAIAAKNVILFLDEAQLFLKDGTGSVDLSNILLPVVQGGALRIILSLNDQEWLKLSQTNPGFTQQLNRVAVRPLDEADVFRVMEDQILFLEARHKVVYMQQSLKEAYRLADRFIHEQAFPGKAIKLLEAAAGFAEQEHFITAVSVQQAVEKTFDVRVQTADSVQEKDTLLNLEQRIHERMINQSRAVKLVSDALRRARAGVRNENKPIGTFLFLGPTGVGKTELSKSLAAVYFGGEDRLIRLDLNEFSGANDSSRLLAVGGQDPYSLCAQIAKQPFSVVLLDEIEKAHPNVLNLLLQMLDEGVLRDSENKPISFKDAIIIATSNAGADKIRAHIDRGEQLEQFEQAFTDELINSNIFRPEFLNRFDEIVLFRPLNQEELMQVVDLLMASLNKTLAQRKVSVSLTPAAKQLLVQNGYDPRLGARPLRRTVQRTVENVVSQKLLAGQIMPGQTLQLDAPELQAALTERQ
ncbi:ATP-dependent Clp protease ATP-binding subunit, partial [Candidatus Saccharibacteria bacterium]|nr:ATP-dependent Clp protease ATP-binding subunit [Candidatus Saccharibacteria bacterium]